MRAKILLSTALLTGLVSGCAHHREFQPQVDPETYSETQFLHYLSSVPTVTFAEGCRAMIIASDGTDAFANHEERYQALRERDVVRDAWEIEPTQSLDVSTMAYMATKICELRPSVSSLLLGSWGLGDRRYAHKLAAAAELVPYEPPYKLVTGGELLYTVAQIDDRLAAKGDSGVGEKIDAPSDVTGR